MVMTMEEARALDRKGAIEYTEAIVLYKTVYQTVRDLFDFTEEDCGDIADTVVRRVTGIPQMTALLKDEM